MRAVPIKVSVDAKEIPAIGKFDYTHTVEFPEKLDEFVTLAGSEENVVDALIAHATRTLKARANFWRQYDKDSKETKETVTNKLDGVMGGNPFVALRGTGDTAIAKAAIEYQDNAKSLKAKYAAGEITLDEMLAQL